MRRFPINSGGTAYTSVWHCDPSGRWTFYTDVAGFGCAEYFGPALSEVVVAPIRVEWHGARRLSIAVDGGRRLTWSLRLTPTLATRAFNVVAPRLAPLFVTHPQLLRLATLIARVALRTGPLRLAGSLPTGAQFMATPWALWIVQSSRACISGHDPGTNRPLDRSLALGDFHIPRRPLFAASHAFISMERG
jgi:hypothetical protein